MEQGAPCPTIIEYFQDKSFSMEIKTPPASYYIKKAAKLKSGSNTPGRETAGSVLKGFANPWANESRHFCCRPPRGVSGGRKAEPAD
jgi:hypothetical protein